MLTEITIISVCIEMLFISHNLQIPGFLYSMSGFILNQEGDVGKIYQRKDIQLEKFPELTALPSGGT